MDGSEQGTHQKCGKRTNDGHLKESTQFPTDGDGGGCVDVMDGVVLVTGLIYTPVETGEREFWTQFMRLITRTDLIKQFQLFIEEIVYTGYSQFYTKSSTGKLISRSLASLTHTHTRRHAICQNQSLQLPASYLEFLVSRVLNEVGLAKTLMLLTSCR